MSFLKDLAGTLAGPLVGGLIARDAAQSSNRFNVRMMREQMAAQKEFAQHGIRWKVEDAKAAGLHPLYALGSQPANYSPVMVSDSVGPAMAEAGQNLGRAISAVSTRTERVAHQLALRQALSNIEETDARRDYYRSLTATTMQGAAATAELPLGPSDGQENIRRFFRGESDAQHGWQDGLYGPARQRDVVEMEIPKVPFASGADTSLVGGRPAMWREFEIAPNRWITLPAANSPSESLEAMSESMPLMWAVYRENIARYGEDWGRWFLDRYFADEAISSPWDTFVDWARARRAKQDGGR